MRPGIDAATVASFRHRVRSRPTPGRTSSGADRAAQWNAWVGDADGAITAATVTLDAIWLYRAQTSYDVNVYVDEVQIRN